MCRWWSAADNRTVSGGANLNIEGIRRTLVDLCRTRPLPRTLFIQAVNASDNKCWTVLLFLAMRSRSARRWTEEVECLDECLLESVKTDRSLPYVTETGHRAVSYPTHTR